MRFNLRMCPDRHSYSVKVERIQAVGAEGNDTDLARIATQQGQQPQYRSRDFFFNSGLQQNQ